VNDDIETAIRQAMPDARVEVTVDGNRALIRVVSQAFADMNRVRKQQSVYACIDDFIRDGRLHAVSIQALTPEEAG